MHRLPIGKSTVISTMLPRPDLTGRGVAEFKKIGETGSYEIMKIEINW